MFIFSLSKIYYRILRKKKALYVWLKVFVIKKIIEKKLRNELYVIR